MAAISVGLLMFQQASLRRTPFCVEGMASDVWVAVLHCVLAAAVPTAYLALLQTARRAEGTVLRGANLSDTITANLPPYGRPHAGWLASGLVGIGFGFLGPWLTEPEIGPPQYFWMVPYWSPEVYWHRLLGLWIVTWMGLFIHVALAISRRASRLARDLRELDPFDPLAPRPFVRIGQANGLAAAALLSILGLLGIDQGVTWMLLIFGSISIVVTVTATLLPILGIRGRIGRARFREAEWCAREMDRERSRVRAAGAVGQGGRLADLAAYREMIASVNPWGFDIPALRRLLLYLLIPLVSWVLSALVQEVVQRVLT
jgi:hypothetical protein